METIERYHKFIRNHPRIAAKLQPEGSFPASISLSFFNGLVLYWKTEHSILSILFNRLDSKFGRRKRILHLLFTVAFMLAVTVLLDVIMLSNLRRDCDRVRYCSSSCEDTHGTDPCGVSIKPLGEDLEYSEYFVYPYTSELGIDYDKCGATATDEPVLCMVCRNFPFETEKERIKHCGTAEDPDTQYKSICPVPTGLCYTPIATNIVRGIVVWCIVTPVSFIIAGCLRCYGSGCFGSFVSFIFLLSAFAAIVVALFVIASVVSQFMSVLSLFLTSWGISLCLEFPLLLVFYMGFGKSNLEDRLVKMRNETIAAAGQELPVVPKLVRVRAQ